ncbi:AAA family ATPase, partial [Megamonas funiformis]
FDNSIKNFEVIGKNRIIKLFSTKFDKPLSLYDYGNGMYKAFFIITATLLSKNGILLIDEIEAGIHTKALTRFMTKLLSVCKINNVQLFMTTHSLEAIDTILYDCQYDNCIDDIAIYHIKNTEKKTDVKRYNGEKMKRLRDNIGFDVR